MHALEQTALPRSGIEVLTCPGCGTPLGRNDEELACLDCPRTFPLIAGIPDLRLSYPDPYVSLEEDRERARELAARFDELDLAGLLREHWRRSGKPVELADRFLAGDLATVERSEAYIAEIERVR